MGWLLTGIRTRTKFSTMRTANFIRSLMALLPFAVVGFLLATGVAMAHDGHVRSGDLPKVSSQSTAAADGSRDLGILDVSLSGEQSVLPGHDDRGSAPCSEDQSDGHGSGTCCIVACHAALAVLLFDPIASPELPGSPIPGLADRLGEQSGDRTERPPKRS